MNILWIPHDTWINPQRAKYLCKCLAKDFVVHVLDFTSFTKIGDYFSRKLFESWVYDKREEGSITIHRVPRLSPSFFSPKVRGINYKIADRFIGKIVKENDIDVVISTSVVKPPKVEKLIFDVYDDNPAYWREFKKNYTLANEIEDIEKDFLRVSDAIVVASHVLQDKVSRESALITNGFESNRVLGGDATRIRDQLDIDGKIVGFIGNHGEFSGLTKVVEVANILKKLDIHFLVAGGGSEVPKAEKIIKRYDLKNITFLGYIDDVADFFSAIDIGLLPSIKCDFRDAASPIKLFEYIVAKVPIVSTDLEEVRRLNFSNVQMVNDIADDLAEGIKNAVEWKPKFPDVTKYEWKNLAEEYKNVIED